MQKRLIGLLTGMLAVSAFSSHVEAATVNQTPSLEVYQLNDYAKLEWAVEMLEEDVLVQSGFEETDTLMPNFHLRDALQYEEGVSNIKVSDSRNVLYRKYAEGWVDKAYFDSGKGTSSISKKINEKYTNFIALKDGTYRLERTIYTNGVQEITTETSYTGKKSYKIGNTYPRLGNRYWFPSQYTNSSYSTFQRMYEIQNNMNLSLSFRAKTNSSAIINPVIYGGMSSWTYPFHEIHGFKTPLTVASPAKRGDSKIYINGINQLNENGIYYVTNRKSVSDRIEHFYYRILTINKQAGYIEIEGRLTEDWDVGYVLQQHVNRAPVNFFTRTISPSDGWVLFNVNSKVLNYADYDSSILGLSLWINSYSKGDTFIDDVKLGFATRTQLFRGNTLLYDGYLSDYQDKNAIDKAIPNKVSNFTTSKNGEQLFLHITKPDDNGTNYSYTVKAISNKGTSTYTSPIKTVNIKTGIKGYSYVVDRQATTIPNGSVQSTDGVIAVPFTVDENSYLHIQSIDYAGNKSEVTHIPLKNIVKQSMYLSVPTIEPFKDITLTDQPKTYTTSFHGSIKIKNYYQRENEKLRLTVHASPLQLKGSSYSLPKGSLYLSPFLETKVINGNGLLPTNKMTNKKAIDGNTVYVAEGIKTIGEYDISFPTNALELTVDPTTAKKGTYTSTLTWQLTSAP